MVSNSHTLLCFYFEMRLSWFSWVKQGSGPDMGQSQNVEWGDFPFIHLSIHLSVRPFPLLGPAAWPEFQPARPED